MAWIFFVAACCLVAFHAEGAPRTAVYNFVKCRPEGDRANCVTQQSAKMEWSPDLPTKLPPSSVQYLDAQPVREEAPVRMTESAEVLQPEDGSGYEGSAGPFWMDYVFGRNAEQETGSGESWTDMDQYKVGREDQQAFRGFLSSSWQEKDKADDKEMEDDHLLQL